MTKAAILTRWVSTVVGGDTFWNPGVFRDVARLPNEEVKDLTGQDGDKIPPAPNVVIVEVNCSDATLAAIKAHAQYGNAAVLWEGDPSQSPVMTAGAYNALVPFLANKFGVSQAAVRNVLTTQGAVVDGVQTRYDFAVKISGYLRTRPKA